MFYTPMNFPNPTAMMPHDELLDLLVEAMKDERSDREKYRIMMDKAKCDKVRRQIEFAFEDEGKHYKMFKSIFKQLTGRTVEIPVPHVDVDDFKDAVESSIDRELEAVELYRKIRAMLPTTKMRDMLYEIITDEQEHATRFVYIFAREY